MKQQEKNEKNIKKAPSLKDQNVERAHEEAEKDIEADPDFHNGPEPGDDLDEGELARFEGGD